MVLHVLDVDVGGAGAALNRIGDELIRQLTLQDIIASLCDCRRLVLMHQARFVIDLCTGLLDNCESAHHLRMQGLARNMEILLAA